MKIKQAKEYFELGVITGFSAIKDIEPGGWLLVVEGKDERSWTLQTALGQPKVFSSLDTLVGEIEKIAGAISSLSIRL